MNLPQEQITISLNSIIGFLADVGVKLCVLIAICMVSTKLGAVYAGLGVIRFIADYMVARQHQAQLQKMYQELIDKSEKL